MKILHWNIHGWRDAEGIDNVERVTKLIGDQDPDVVSLVEVDEIWGQPLNIERVANELGYHWAFIPAFEYRQEGGFGNALLSKTPFLSIQQRHLLPPGLYDGTEPSEQRTLLLASIDTGGGPVSVGSTHLSRSQPKMRERAIAELTHVLRGVELPWVVSGDFNAPPEDLGDLAGSVAPAGFEPTYPAGKPTEAIDYSIARAFSLVGSVLGECESSDHLAVLVEAARC